MDGGEFAGVGTLAGQAVEGPDDLKRGLGYRLFKVTAGRADRTADGDRSQAAVFEPYDTGSFVEAGNRRFKVRGEGFLTGYFLKAA